MYNVFCSMSSLSLLAAYCSDEEDYSDAESSSDSTEKKVKIFVNTDGPIEESHKGQSNVIQAHASEDSREPLPVPPEIEKMFGESSSQAADDPEEHGGKIRSFPHERGIWATFVFIEYHPEPEFHSFVDSLMKLAVMHGISLIKSNNFHISLSRTLKLRYHWISPFIESLKIQLRGFHKFKIMLESPEVYANDEKTRTFVGLKVHYGFEHLERIAKQIDKSLMEFKLPFYYEDPSFHLSCASCVGDVVKRIELIMADINVAFQTFVDRNPQSRTLWITNIYCKSGNKMFTIPLQL